MRGLLRSNARQQHVVDPLNVLVRVATAAPAVQSRVLARAYFLRCPSTLKTACPRLRCPDNRVRSDSSPQNREEPSMSRLVHFVEAQTASGAKPTPGTGAAGSLAARGRGPRATRAFAVALLFVVALAVPAAQRKTQTRPALDSSNFHALDQIKKANVSQLEVAWFYPYGAPTFSPVFAHDVLYGLGRNGVVARRARRDDRQGDLGPRRPERHHEQGHQLLGERGRQGPPADLRGRQLPAGDRRARPARSIPTFGIERRRRHARAACCAPRARASRAMPASPGRIWKNIDRSSAASRARRS